MKKPFLVVSLLILALVGIVSTFFLVQQKTSTKSRAEKTVTLSFSPTSSATTPITVNSGGEFTTEVLLNPGTNLVSTAKVTILYDPSKFQPAEGNALIINDEAFSQVVEGPIFTPGKISFTASIGSDPAKAINAQTSVASIKFKALSFASTSEGATLIDFGTDSLVTSISKNSSPTENVIANTVPATVLINDTQTLSDISSNNTPTTTTTTNTKTVSIPSSVCILKTRLCNLLQITSVETSSVLKVNYKLSHSATISNHSSNWGHYGKSKKTYKPTPKVQTCSSIRVHFYVDGVKKYTSGWFSASKPLTGNVDFGPVTPGVHIIALQPEASSSTCKHIAWTGSLTITTNTSITVPPAPPTTTCSAKAPVDAILVMDVSGSMNDKITGSTRKLQLAKTSANSFVNILAADTRNKIGLVSYNYRATLQSPLTGTYSTITSKINALSATGATCIQCGINKAKQDFTTNGRAGYKKAVILLTDGRANQVEGGPNKNGNTTVAEAAALAAALADYNANNTVYYTIGLGRDVNSNFLRQIANATGGRYYFSPTGSDLNQIYTQISHIVTQGSISGYVYHDINNNNMFDSTDTKLAERQVQLKQNNTIVQTVTTDEAGSYTVSGICGGTYTLSQILKSGWVQTEPTTASGYTVTITNANTNTGKNFGTTETVVPTPTPTQVPLPTETPSSTPPIGGGPSNTPVPTVAPTLTQIPTSVPTAIPTLTTIPTPTGPQTLVNLDLFLHGIGKVGDNTNPSGFTLSNQNPLHPNQTAHVSVFDASNNLVASSTGNVTFNTTTGSYKGSVNLGGAVSTGVYTVKVKTDRHLYRLIAGIHTLTTGQANTLPTTDLVAGDTNDDNKINILDYNALINCYSDLSPAVACNPTLKLQTDLNDDGNVNQIDYNLFLREIATQPGQ